MKIEVQLQGGLRKIIDITPGATVGGTIGRNIFNADGTLFVPSAGGNGDPVSVTSWELILNIPPNVTALANTTTTGLYVVTGSGTSATRTITPVAGETTVVNGDGVAGNPEIGLADVTPSAGGSIQRLGFDAKGRRSEADAATTDNLPEGVTNLYFTDARAQAAVVVQTVTIGDTMHSPSGDAVFSFVSAAAGASLVAAMDYATSIVDDLTPESLGMGAGFDQTTGSRLADIDTMFGQPPTFFSCASTATGIPVAISGQGAYIPFSTTAGMQIYASASVQDVNRRLFYRAGSGSTWGNWIEFGFRYWNAASAASGNISPNLDLNDAMIRTALAISPTINNPSGTKHNGRVLTLRLRDNGTARGLTWGSEYRASSTIALPTTTTIGKTLYVEFIVNADEVTLDLMRVMLLP